MSLRAAYGVLMPILALVVALGPVTAAGRLQPRQQSIGAVAPALRVATAAPAPRAGAVSGAPATQPGVALGAPATRPAASSPPTSSLSLSMLHAEPAHLDSFGLPYKGQEQLFVKLNVSYQSATERYFYFDPHNLVMTNITGTNFYPQGFIGSDQLTAKEMFVFNGQPTTENGWIFFSSLTITSAVGLRVLYKGITQAPTGGTEPYVAASTPPFNPIASPKRDYAVATQTALKTYLLDEALAVGYIRLHVAPLYQNGGGGGLPGGARAYLQTQYDQLVADHHTFDAVPATGKDPLLLKTSVDTAFTALEMTIAGIIAIHGPADWTTLQGALDTDDAAIDGLYQTWPGAQLGNQ